MTSPKEKSTQSARQMEIDIEIPLPPIQRKKIHFALLIAFIGFLFFLVGAQPGWFFLDRSPVVGFVQIAVMLIGLAIMCTGGYVAMHLAIQKLLVQKIIKKTPIIHQLAAISCGVVNGNVIVDLDYSEDSNAEVDANFVMTGDGKIIEIQSTAESEPFSQEQFNQMLKLSSEAIKELIKLQNEAITHA